MNDQDFTFPLFASGVLFYFGLRSYWDDFSFPTKFLVGGSVSITLVSIGLFYWHFFSRFGRDRRKIREQITQIPEDLKAKEKDSAFLGIECDLNIPIFLPDHIRCRHVHILGATGSGKTESVILNLIRQDVARGLGAIVIDAKGDMSFMEFLASIVPKDRLQVFDLGDENSLPYDPLRFGTPIEAAQRLFSSLVWSEEYYKSKAFAAVQKLFQSYFRKNNSNPTLADLSSILKSESSYLHYLGLPENTKSHSSSEFTDISGLKDQIDSLNIGHLSKTLSPSKDAPQATPELAGDGHVIYFRLQSLMSPQIVVTLGKFLINHLNFLAGTAHRGDEHASERKLIPTFVDEFASFACPEFADLISKARSAKIALHFSHQSIGDLTDISKGFLARITDNSATKIVMRVNDPDTAEHLAWSFGTREIQKVTQRIINSKEVDKAENLGEGSARMAHQFRASPDLLKTLPTSVGSVLIAHGIPTPQGGSSVFKIRFPRL